MSYTKVIAGRLKELRKKRGITQADAADRLGVSRSTLASWEAGIREPNAMDLYNIRECFKVSSDYLMGFSDKYETMTVPKMYDIDLNKLNAMGKQLLYEMYKVFLQNDAYRK